MHSVHLHSDKFPQPDLRQLCSCGLVSKEAESNSGKIQY